VAAAGPEPAAGADDDPREPEFDAEPEPVLPELRRPESSDPAECFAAEPLFAVEDADELPLLLCAGPGR
jgi:hypothetical protein